MLSPLRYPGGKARLFSYFSELISLNSYFSKTYCEPYSGGAGLALKLLSHGFIAKLELNDIDRAIVAFWNSILEDTTSFCDRIETAPLTVAEWLRQREIYRRGSSANRLDLGFATYYLNRTSRSGIIEGSGPIGGYKQLGEWKIDARLNKPAQIANIKSVAKLASYINVTQTDAMVFLQSRLKNDECFIYLDPPYYVKGRKLYKNFYHHDDHVGIAELLSQSRSANWLISYDHVPEIVEIYDNFTPTIYNLQYSAGRCVIGSEVIFASDSVKLPVAAGFRLAA
jgi:DNA adenine methylase